MSYELRLLRKFRARAHLRHHTCPDYFDYFGWLSLMRHYGLPTRLLDWSESPLVAAYFAMVSADPKRTAMRKLAEGRLLERMGWGGNTPTWKRVLRRIRDGRRAL